MAGYNETVWKNIELSIEPEHVFTLFQISSMNKKDRFKIPLKPKAHFKWVYGHYSINISKIFDTCNCFL